MPDFKIGDHYISASDEATAKRIVGIVREQSDTDRMLIIDSFDELILIKLTNDKPIKVYSSLSKRTTFCGTVMNGIGDKIIQASLDSVNKNAQVQKLAQLSLKKIRTDPKDIVIFESTLTSATRELYDDLMRRIDTTTESAKLDLLSNFGDIRIPTENWIPILSLVRQKVAADEEKPVDERQYNSAWRKYFAAVAASMVKNGVRSSNTMRGVKQDGKPDIDWLKYAKNKSGS